MHPKQELLEQQMAKLCQALDNWLEDGFGENWPIHPNRMKRGTGANPSFDGLFSTSVAFTLGYGSKSGRGYLVNVDIRTLKFVTSQEKTEVLDAAASFLRNNIEEYIPDRKLDVVKEGNLIKIVGDFSLGEN